MQTALPGVDQHECGAENDFGKLLTMQWPETE